MGPKCKICLWYGLFSTLNLEHLQNNWLQFRFESLNLKLSPLSWKTPLRIIVHITWKGILVKQKCGEVLLFLIRLNIQTHVCSLLYQLRFFFKESVDKFFHRGGLFASKNHEKCPPHRNYIGDRRQAATMLLVESYQNISFQFFCPSLE